MFINKNAPKFHWKKQKQKQFTVSDNDRKYSHIVNLFGRMHINNNMIICIAAVAFFVLCSTSCAILLNISAVHSQYKIDFKMYFKKNRLTINWLSPKPFCICFATKELFWLYFFMCFVDCLVPLTICFVKFVWKLVSAFDLFPNYTDATCQMCLMALETEITFNRQNTRWRTNVYFENRLFYSKENLWRKMITLRHFEKIEEASK